MPSYLRLVDLFRTNSPRSTMKHLYAFAFFACSSVLGVNAQYCVPTFVNGCYGWQVLSMTAGTLNWTSSDCTNWDQTAYVISGDAADSILMSVTSGAWCGATMWVDWDNSGSFEEAENVYHQYVGGDPSYTYNFNIGIPVGTTTGQYRLRVVGAWGSDGFTSGENGFGPCGSYQYGNYNDFMLQVSNTTSVLTLDASITAVLSASPNPTNGAVSLLLGDRQSTQIDLVAMDGRTVREWQSTGAATMELDLSDLPAGLYLVQDRSNATAHPLRLVKL